MIIVSEKFASEYWHDPSSAIGKQVGDGPNGAWREVIGVMPDVHLASAASNGRRVFDLKGELTGGLY